MTQLSGIRHTGDLKKAGPHQEGAGANLTWQMAEIPEKKCRVILVVDIKFPANYLWLPEAITKG